MTPLKKIQEWMIVNDVDIFIVNRTDEFLNEYISPYAERLNWISNFSGSAGKSIIEQNNAFIFVDGRYTNQASNQVDLKYFKIKHLKTYWSHLKNYSKEIKIIALDPLLHSISEVEKIYSLFKDFPISINFPKINPIDIEWKNKPKYPNSKAFIHDVKYSGEESKSKIKRIQKKIQSNNLDIYLSSSLDSIAWLLNIRGNDIKYTPLLFCYIVIPKEGKIELFVNKSKIEHLVSNYKSIANINSFEKINEFFDLLDNKKIVGVDFNSTSYFFKNMFIKNNISLIDIEDPCLYPKARKNNTELEGAIKANIRDGVSISKFLYWIKNIKNINEVNEIIAAEYLLELRKKNELYYSPSFDTISALSYHAALPHYRVTKESNIFFKNNSIYLVDSGVQYIDGTTDITRTIIIGIPTEEQKDRFTRVLKGHIAISEAIFSPDCKGSELDPLARKFLKEINCDYDHGTGHGIGSFLSVHEGPQRIAKSQGQSDGVIQEGMIISNEPGYYKKGEYGIRIENLLITRSFNKQNKKQLYFETISWAPIDIDLIKISLLSKNEKKWLNNYHRKVYENISPNLSLEESKWLKSVTKLIK